MVNSLWGFIGIQVRIFLLPVLRSENSEKTQDGKRYLHREFSYSSFRQAFTLPENIDKRNIGASVDNGVLTVCLPKKKEEEKKNNCHYIEIK